MEFKHQHSQETLDRMQEESERTGRSFAVSLDKHFYVVRSRYPEQSYMVSQDLNGYQSSTLGMTLAEMAELADMLTRFILQENVKMMKEVKSD